MRFATQDGTLVFSMRRQGDRLFVERLQLRPMDTQLVQCLLFDSIANLQRWAETDPLRFEDPALHQRLYRCGEQILNEPA